MKLPKKLVGVQREGRSDAFGYSGDSGVSLQWIPGRKWLCKKACKAAYWGCKKIC